MNTKRQLYLYLGILSVLIVLLVFLGIAQSNNLMLVSQNILKDNYRSLEYSQQMLQSLDKQPISEENLNNFQKNLRLQQQNITEEGEAALCQKLTQEFELLRQHRDSIELSANIKNLLYDINLLNRQAILRKSETAEKEAQREIYKISILGIFCIGIALTLLFVVPGSISNPIRQRDQAKTQFIATISHELKTPIASIKLALQLLENQQTGALNEQQQQLADSIKEDSERLLKITSELLDIAQAESGKIRLSIQPCDAEEIAQYAIQATTLQAQQRGIVIDFLCPQPPPSLLADSEKTAWVLTNLISNAIRYSPANNRVQVHINQSDNYVRFEVKDQGTGILPEHQQQLFNRYFKVPGASKGGTGLGLSISKDFIEAQNGRISVQSQLNQGSCFVVEIPKA